MHLFNFQIFPFFLLNIFPIRLKKYGFFNKEIVNVSINFLCIQMRITFFFVIISSYRKVIYNVGEKVLTESGVVRI